MKYRKRNEIFFDSETVLATVLSRLIAMTIDFVIIITFLLYYFYDTFIDHKIILFLSFLRLHALYNRFFCILYLFRQ